ncbi:radical SAM protein [Thermodesulfobacteriota bacterium]
MKYSAYGCPAPGIDNTTGILYLNPMFNANRRYQIHWELTDLCNLKCPMCPRTDSLDHCRPVKSIQNTQFFLKDVKKYFPDDFLRKSSRIDFCGNFGDPCVARDFFEICRFLIEDYGITLSASTNGAMRNPAWWKKLGALFSETESRIEFHIDGLKDTNHLYRINANWDKIMANTEAFISAGARADWYYILFKHNQHQIDQTIELARERGFNQFVLIDTVRFPENGTYRYMHPDGHTCKLERVTISNRHGINHAKQLVLRSEDEHLPGKSTPKKTMASQEAASVNSFQEHTARFLTPVNGIACKASKHNRLYIDTGGNIAPCCWVSSNDIQRPGNMHTALTMAGKDIDNFNIRNRSIEKILHDDIFSKFFKDLWESDVLSTCRKKCGKKRRNVRSRLQL